MNYEEKAVSVCCRAVWEPLNISKQVERRSWFKYCVQQQVPTVCSDWTRGFHRRDLHISPLIDTMKLEAPWNILK